MRRVIPYPTLSLGLLALWLLLWQSVAPLTLVGGAVVALLLPRVMLRLDEDGPNLKRPLLALRLFLTVLYDIALSNLTVARLVLTGRQLQIESGFVNIPLELRDRYGLAALATIVTATPGTFWAAYDRRTNVLTLHVFELVDEEHVRSNIKERYERPLRGIFE